MERLRSLSRPAGVVVLALIVGCTSTPPAELIPDSVMRTMSLETSEPASQIVCFWQRRLSSLPDPTRDGAQTMGIAGQMFLISPSNSPAAINGDLSVVVYDETPRPAGQTALQPELWHYTGDTLKRLSTMDERFGQSFVLFLPWPQHWQGNVTAVKILARYQSKGNPDLFAGEVRMALDFSAGGRVWSDVGTTTTTAPVENRSVPDASRMLQQAKSAATAQPFPASGFGTPAVNTTSTPPTMAVPPASWPPPAPPPPTLTLPPAAPVMPQGAPVLPPPGSVSQPIIAPRG